MYANTAQSRKLCRNDGKKSTLKKLWVQSSKNHADAAFHGYWIILFIINYPHEWWSPLTCHLKQSTTQFSIRFIIALLKSRTKRQKAFVNLCYANNINIPFAIQVCSYGSSRLYECTLLWTHSYRLRLFSAYPNHFEIELASSAA